MGFFNSDFDMQSTCTTRCRQSKNNLQTWDSSTATSTCNLHVQLDVVNQKIICEHGILQQRLWHAIYMYNSMSSVKKNANMGFFNSHFGIRSTCATRCRQSKNNLWTWDSSTATLTCNLHVQFDVVNQKIICEHGVLQQRLWHAIYMYNSMSSIKK